jgi:hypothetical protein
MPSGQRHAEGHDAEGDDRDAGRHQRDAAGIVPTIALASGADGEHDRGGGRADRLVTLRARGHDQRDAGFSRSPS